MKIKLEFKKSTTRLAYYPFGKETYEKQVKPYIDFNGEKIQIEFPNQIVKVASSFVQGFFEEMVSTIGYEEIFKRVEIISENESLKKSIYDNLLF